MLFIKENLKIKRNLLECDKNVILKLVGVETNLNTVLRIILKYKQLDLSNATA